MIGRRRWPSFVRAALRGRRPALLPQGDVFLRGLALGALVGAAIAGSTVWGRLRRREGSSKSR
jgi:hypothetical protein